jgi:transposase
MDKVIKDGTEMTIGVDLGDKWSRLCVLDEHGEVCEEGRIATTAEAMRKRFSTESSCRIVIEVGTHSPWVQRLLKELGHEVITAHTQSVRLIYGGTNKNDQLDAERLARLARVDPKLLHPIQHREGSTQADRAVIRSRYVLVGCRTKLINHARGMVKSMGGRLPTCTADCFPKRVREAVPKELKPALRPVLETIAALTTKIRRFDRLIEELASKRYPETNVLRQVSGVGPVTSLSFVLTVEDPARFRRSRALGAYLGLSPRRSQSGDVDPELRITKAGDNDLRRRLGAIHPGSIRAGHRSQALGTRACRPGQEEREEACRGGRGAQVGRAAAPAVGHC